MNPSSIASLASIALPLFLGFASLGESAASFAQPGTPPPVGAPRDVRNMSNENPAATRKSISGWVSCKGVTDDTAGVARAFAAAKNGAFTLVVDCPVIIKIGIDISRTIFIDNGTTVEFTRAGKFTVDNVLIPAFAIANSSNITLTNWNVEYDASLPVNPNVGGYKKNGRFMAGAQPSSAFNDLLITPWLAANRGIVFDRSQGNVNSRWTGPTNTGAVFFIIGDVSHVAVTGMKVYVPATAGGERFVPVVFALAPNYKSGQTVTAKTPLTAQYMGIPHEFIFSNIVLDGTYMGWVGSVRDVTFENIQSHRYGDLQDAQGNNSGGMGKWFAPPHLFYLAYSPDGDPALFNSNIRIENVVDDGPRVGSARDKGGSETLSGYALSLKIGCIDCSVDTYSTSRPDGFLDVLPSNRLTISNVKATYDSSFLNNVFPGWRFPSSSYKNMVFKNIVLKDLAPSSTVAPVGPSNQESNENMTIDNVKVEINRWSGKGLPVSNILGKGHKISLDYSVAADASRIKSVQQGTVALTLQAAPSTLQVGNATSLSWTSRGADNCSASGAWSGPLATTGGPRTVQLTTAGNSDFTIECRNANDAATTTLSVVVAP
jgi:hypothetical protein